MAVPTKEQTGAVHGRRTRFAARLTPVLALATAVALAGVCDDISKTIQTAYSADFSSAVLALIQAIAVTVCFGTPVRMLILRFVKRAKLVDVLTTSIQVLTGWMWKGFVGQVVMSLQRTYVEPQEREDPDNPSSSYSQLVRLGCFGIALGAAVVFTLPAVMTAFLPPSSKHVVTSPPSAFLGSYISHLSGHLAGATPLPFAFAWYLAFDGLLLLAISGRTPEAAEDSSRTEPRQVVLLMGLKVALLAVLTLVVGGIKLGLFRLFRVLDAKASRLKDKRLHKIVKRGRQLALVACNFILAWPAFDILALLWKNLGGSPCYPRIFASIIPSSVGWIAILLTILALVLLILLVAAYVTHEAERICRSRLLALAFETLLATLPIMLGWAIKDLYLLYIVNDDIPFLSFIIIFVVIGLVALLVVYDVIVERRARMKRRAVNTNLPSEDSDSDSSKSGGEEEPAKL